MVGGPEGEADGALEDIAYLSRSVNRVGILDALAAGSRSRRELTEELGIARTTVGRIVKELEERGWVERTTDGRYAATPTGEQVAAEFAPLVDAMAAIRRLGETVAWFRDVEPPLALRHLRDAAVLRPESDDLMAPTEAYLSDLRRASEFHGVVGITAPVRFEDAMREGVVERGMHLEHVISDTVYDYVLDHPDRVARRRESLEAGANLYRYDGAVPCNVFVLDETVYVANSQSEYGAPYTVVRTDDAAVRSWAHEFVDAYRAASERLGPDAFD